MTEQEVMSKIETGRVITDDDIQRFEQNRAETQRRKEAGEDVSWTAYRDKFMSL